jgi:cephalosporin hydroxylase
MTIANDPEYFRAMAADPEARDAIRRLIAVMHKHRYAYNFSWLGRPIIQLPQDVLAIQEILWAVRPRTVVETGIAHGGSLVLSASILELLGGDGRVIGVDIDIREHNRRAIEAHPLARRIDMVQGSSIDPAVVADLRRRAEGRGPVVVILDSMHTHDHVLAELRAYAPLVGRGSYVVVLDTLIEDQPPGDFRDRPWGPGNSPKTAVHAFLRESGRFELDSDLEARLLVTVAPDGFLKCVRDEV